MSDTLPNEMILEIMKYLEPQDQLHLISLNKRFRTLIRFANLTLYLTSDNWDEIYSLSTQHNFLIDRNNLNFSLNYIKKINVEQFVEKNLDNVKLYQMVRFIKQIKPNEVQLSSLGIINLNFDVWFYKEIVVNSAHTQIKLIGNTDLSYNTKYFFIWTKSLKEIPIHNKCTIIVKKTCDEIEKKAFALYASHPNIKIIFDPVPGAEEIIFR
jgi:hypothetical protein